jgi:hypothetical protein
MARISPAAPEDSLSGTGTSWGHKVRRELLHQAHGASHQVADQTRRSGSPCKDLASGAPKVARSPRLSIAGHRLNASFTDLTGNLVVSFRTGRGGAWGNSYGPAGNAGHVFS